MWGRFYLAVGAEEEQKFRSWRLADLGESFELLMVWICSSVRIEIEREMFKLFIFFLETVSTTRSSYRR